MKYILLATLHEYERYYITYNVHCIVDNVPHTYCTLAIRFLSYSSTQISLIFAIQITLVVAIQISLIFAIQISLVVAIQIPLIFARHF